LGRLDFLVVQDMYTTTETAQLAHLILPAAGWGEKEGTFINSERRIGVVKRIAAAPGNAIDDFHIFRMIADAWGCADVLAEWSSPKAVFQILKRLSRGQPCDITGIEDYLMIETARGIQWPFPEGSEPEIGAQRRLFADGRFFHPNERARFVFEEPRPVAEPTSERFPLILLTGRGSSSQWHTQTRTAKSSVLRSLYDEEAYVEISPDDACERSLQPGDVAVVSSARGSMRAKTVVTPTVASGQVFIAMHYTETNRLTNPSFDPYSRQPSYKNAAVQVRRAMRGER
jgi:assimilatory nitrate reductase catalytic subunit